MSRAAPSLSPSLSLNELRFYVTRAAAGAGAPFGIGENLTEAAIWLAAAGLDPAVPLAEALGALDQQQSDPGILQKGPRLHSMSDKPLSAIFAGPAAADQLALSDRGRRIRLENVDHPLLGLAFAACLSGAQNLVATWDLGDGTTGNVRCIGGRTLAAGIDIAELTQAGPADLNLHVSDDASFGAAPKGEIDLTAGKALLLERGVPVDATAWDVILQIFKKYLVPSTDQSRQSGAGAGLNDND